eukprot:CAMPEP_0197829772 /NCGR_PEP_ID=MMETSP1437-20131217/6322_1 /TAXON_ID=49252 ORGANISM="Eucampia antarctica, Strain CCMP1452" /NCGR_SAMPLE_ID=MMETSP1437 /ASSEMBLY_ACC=CAM_ASM_001096 /LENGTH=554 /DNA_ID=CAMNT_0043431731 /DNA_START=345 /DNA_END=2009 /DNA_ORIENTATION=-
MIGRNSFSSLASSSTADDDSSTSADTDDFFSTENPDFKSLLSEGLETMRYDNTDEGEDNLKSLVSRLEDKCKLSRPSAVQSAAYKAILSGKDVTIGAETGSGKTYAYLLPLVQDILLQKSQNNLQYEYCRAIILVPNKELAQQVVRMAAPLCGGMDKCLLWGGNDKNGPLQIDDVEEEKKIVRLAIVPGGLSEPIDFKPFRDALQGDAAPVDLLVATPAALGLWALSPKNVDFFEDVQTLIIDEADMLLDGGYLRPLQNVLMGFRRADRLAARYHNNEEQEEVAPVMKTQHVFVGATLPDSGLKSVDAFLQKRFPYSERVIMPSMHNAKHYGHSQKNMWIPDDPDETTPNKARLQKLVQMLQDPSQLENDKVMVFLNTVQDVENAASALLRAGIEAVPYHAKIKLDARVENLQRFRHGTDDDKNVVLVCTDLAARGLDVPGVTAVVQLQFATNVVTHLHRMGRCGRAGIRNGKSVVFHSTTEQEAEVVKVVQSAEQNRSITSLQGSDVLDEDDDDDESKVGKVNNAFSRKRGFTKKRKKLERNAREGRQNSQNQ